MLKDEGISEFRKITAALEMFLYDYWKTEGLPFDEQYELFKDILREFLNIDMDAQGDPGQPPKKKEYDFNVDAERIYASFLMDYNIDLHQERGKMHWKKFIALLSGLSEKTPFMQVVNIRTMDIPKETKHNQKERQKIIKLQDKYSLATPEEKLAAMDAQFDSVANSLIGREGE
jgi:hypothetical protein